jgi:prepilin-type N-terminal cleavage/methylation domain-containing protein
MPNHSLANSMRYAHRRPASGFTLVELMVVLIIISILATVVMFAMFNAQEAARVAKTKGVISKLNAVIMQRYQSYLTRRLPIPSPVSNTQLVAFRFHRLQALREMMRMELPDRWTDVRDPSVTGIRPPSVNRTYQRKINAANNGNGVTDGDSFQGAECLYLIIAHGADDADALTHFSQSDIGDTDGDGLLEFLDGWGRPISFIRWPAGFASPRQSRDETKDFDQFNPWRIPDIATPTPPDRAPPSGALRRFAMFPLIYSGGPDKKYDLATGIVGGEIHYAWGSPPTGYVDPYLYVKDPATGQYFQMGQPNDNDADGSLDHGDNIHNHDLTIR